MDESLKKRIIRNSFWSFFSATISRVGALVISIILTRFLMPEGYGRYSIILSTAMIFYTFADLGINQTLMRYLSESLSKNKKALSAYHWYLLKLKFVLSLIVSLALLALSYPISNYFFKDSALFVPLMISAGYIFITSFETLYSQIFYSLEKVSYLGVRESLNQVLRISFLFGVFFLTTYSFFLVGIYLSYILASLLLLIFSLFYLRKIAPKLFSRTSVVIDKKRVIKFVWLLSIASISTVFFSYIDSILLALFIAPEYIGYYKAAFSMVIGIIGLLSFPNLMLLSVFTKLKKPKIEELFNTIFKYISIISIPAAFGILVLGKYFLVFFFGYSYLPAALPLYILSLLILPSVYIGLFLSLFSAEERPGVFAKLIVLVSLVNIALNFILIPLFLIISPLWATAGAAIATLASWIFYLFAFIKVSKKELHIKVSPLPMIKPLIASVIMAAVLLFFLSFAKDMSLLMGVVSIIIGIIIYAVIMLLIKGIKKSDINLFRYILKTTKK